jgi:V8-like Glu-specific endopeptidase
MYERMRSVIGEMAVVMTCAPMLVGCLAPADQPALGNVEQATTCGSTDESQHVNLYNGSFERFPTAFVRAHKGPVGALETTNSNSSSVKFCTGTLISANRFLTAGHCIDSGSVGEFVSFNYEVNLIPFVTVGPQTHVAITEVLEDDVGGVDYAIVRLAGSPGNTFGVTGVASVDAPVGSPIAMIGHPAGDPKMVEAGTVAVDSDTSRIRYFNLDTLGGSSGSGLLDPAGRIVGVHTNGGCTESGGTNSGMQISRIRAVSSLL